MKVCSRGPIGRAFWVLFILLLPASAIADEIPEYQNTQQVQDLWEQAVAAKGGREQLERVNSLLISYRETVRNFLGVVVHRGDVERLYVFPDKMWGWDDGLPPPFRLTVNLLDIGRDRRCTLYKGAAAPICGPARQGSAPPDEGLVQVQLLYLMESRWVKPTPVGVTKDKIGFQQVDVLHARFQDKRVDYFLDRKTHLPIRVSIFYGASERPTISFELSDYAPVGGVLMPGKQKRAKINFQINPPYDETIFTRPPSFEAGPRGFRAGKAAL
jgi:hypothetical protein